MGTKRIKMKEGVYDDRFDGKQVLVEYRFERDVKLNCKRVSTNRLILPITWTQSGGSVLITRIRY